MPSYRRILSPTSPDMVPLFVPGSYCRNVSLQCRCQALFRHLYRAQTRGVECKGIAGGVDKLFIAYSIFP